MASLEAQAVYKQIKTEEPENHLIKTENHFNVETELEISNLTENFSALSRPPAYQNIKKKANSMQNFEEIDEIELKILEMQCKSSYFVQFLRIVRKVRQCDQMSTKEHVKKKVSDLGSNHNFIGMNEYKQNMNKIV